MDIYGGFDGSESSRDQRDWETNLTVLSGDIDQNDQNVVNGVLSSYDGIIGNNSYHVVCGESIDGNMVLDGFSITGGATPSAGTTRERSGGGILLYKTSPTLLNLTIRGNRSNQFGGGIYIEFPDSGSSIRNLVIRDNLVNGGGGGIYIEGSIALPVDDSHILSNESRNNFKSCNVETNSGGGVLASRAIVYYRNVVIERNVADCYGGGLSQIQGTFRISGGAFLNNRARNIGNEEPVNGGGIYALDPLNNNYVISTLFVGNSAEDSDAEGGSSGGAISASWNAPRGNLYLSASTFVDNTAQAGSAISSFSNLSSSNRVKILLTNSIIGSHASPSMFGTAEEIKVANSLVEGSGGSGPGWNPGFGLDLGDNIDSIPGFLQPAIGSNPNVTGDFRLALGSPAIDAGDKDLPSEYPLSSTDSDNAGNPRVFNGKLDMGAYETQVVCPPGSTTQLHVDDTATGAATGVSWSDALPRLQDALTLAHRCPSNSISEIWVAQGTYYPDEGSFQTDGDRDVAFELKNGLSIYGGFVGNETDRDQRDPWSFVTVLSGDIDQDDNTDAHDLVETPADIVGDNSYHVVLASGTNSSAVLDGFAITGGQGNGSPAAKQHEGGGLFAEAGSPTLNNLTFAGNIAEEGGAMTLVGGSNPAISNAWFRGNAASDYGGALHNESSSPTLTNVQMSGNRAAAGGGAIYNLASSPELTNVTISGNAAGGTVSLAAVNSAAVEIAPTGGGILNLTGSKPEIRNSIIWNNEDSSGVGTASASIRNLDIGSTPSADYSDIQGLAGITGLLYDGTSIDADPLFVVDADPSTAPAFTPALRLKGNSPAIDVGNDSFNSLPVDLGQQPRIQGTAIDMGAFEASPAPHIALHKSINTPTANVGETVIYTYEVINTGNVKLTAISATDDRLGTIDFGVSELLPNASASTTLTYMVVESDLPGPLTNMATVTGTSSVSGTVVATDMASLSLSYRPRLAVEKTASVATALPGDTVTYTYVVKNNGDVSLSSVSATDSALGAVTLSATSLAPGASATGTLDYTVEKGDLPGPLVNVVEVQGTSPAGTVVKDQDSATVGVVDPTPPSVPSELYLPLVQK